jgi:polysulfide reductase chain C
MEHMNWGVPVAFDLFLAGFGAGAFLLAVIAELAGGKRYQKITRVGAFIAPWPVLLGVLLLVVDLGNPLRFWEFLIRRGPGFIMFNPGSVMSVGVWLLTVFVILSLIYLLLDLFGWAVGGADKLKKIVGIIGLPFALLVTVYTGVLLAATSNPLWNTILLPAVFSVSAVSIGIAGVVFVMAASTKSDQAVPKLEKINSSVIGLQLLLVVLFVVLRIFTEPVKLIAGSNFGILLWVVIIGAGLLVPLFSGVSGKAKSPQTSLIISALVLLGGFLLRYVILIGGQV